MGFLASAVLPPDAYQVYAIHRSEYITVHPLLMDEKKKKKPSIVTAV